LLWLGHKKRAFFLSWRIISILVLAAAFPVSVFATCRDQPPDGEIIANPNRPTVSNPADITQYGVLETEYGYTRTWPGGNNHQNDIAGLFKFAVACDFELRWDTDDFINQYTNGITENGVGDQMIGGQYRYHHQSKNLPALAVQYEIKLPVASLSKNLGTGKVDHDISFLMASKDIGKYHFDFNAGYLLAGRAFANGYDKNFNLALAFSHPLKKSFGITGEFSGETQLNPQTPAFASTLWAITYKTSQRLIFDAGYDVGLTSGSPGKQFLVGVTYSIADIYGKFRHPQTNPRVATNF
jgi:hypothetical protein